MQNCKIKNYKIILFQNTGTTKQFIHSLNELSRKVVRLEHPKLPLARFSTTDVLKLVPAKLK